ncbi:uncharacterized protein LOC122312671 [Carya illinoinensis]|uniref:uncharacterized protein LOC122312671 n=1 Tax=Carya illinoinensis TaxID=32201 RepID=UPI001C719433|nr:uncharacterized protein LOC122312671 [Carya illinoinensis]
MLVWNIRGLGTSRRRIRSLVRKYEVSVLVVLEPFQEDSKLQSWAASLQFSNYCSNLKEGGKMWVIWKDEINLEILDINKQSMTAIVVDPGGSLRITFVHAKCSQAERRALWDNLKTMLNTNDTWVVLGDFNIIRYDMERVGSRPRPSSAMEEFNECINGCGPMDLPLVGKQLSWCNGQQGLARSWAKLDRNMWTSHDGFLDMVRNSWNEPIRWEPGLLNLAGKLKRLKQKMRQWNREIFGRVDAIIKELEEREEIYEEVLQDNYSEEIEQEFLINKAELEIWYCCPND